MLTTREACLLLADAILYLLLMLLLLLNLSKILNLLLHLFDQDRGALGHTIGFAILLVWTLWTMCRFTS